MKSCSDPLIGILLKKITMPRRCSLRIFTACRCLSVNRGWGCVYPSMPCRSHDQPGGCPGPGRGRGEAQAQGCVYPSIHRGRPQQSATAAGSMQPTGMHSCSSLRSFFKVVCNHAIYHASPSPLPPLYGLPSLFTYCCINSQHTDR